VILFYPYCIAQTQEESRSISECNTSFGTYVSQRSNLQSPGLSGQKPPLREIIERSRLARKGGMDYAGNRRLKNNNLARI